MLAYVVIYININIYIYIYIYIYIDNCIANLYNFIYIYINIHLNLSSVPAYMQCLLHVPGTSNETASSANKFCILLL